MLLAPELEPSDHALALLALDRWRAGETFDQISAAVDVPPAALETFLMRAMLPPFTEPPKRRGRAGRGEPY